MRVANRRGLAGRNVAGVAATLLLAAACSGTEANSTNQRQQAAGDNSDAAVAVRTVDGVGEVLTNPDGMTLYTADVEKDGKIACVNACTENWPPLTTDTDVPTTVDGANGEVGVIERPDQTMQLTLDSRPLYTFKKDSRPGSLRGDGFEDDFGGKHFVWEIITINDTAADDVKPPAGGTGGTDDSDRGRYDY